MGEKRQPDYVILLKKKGKKKSGKLELFSAWGWPGERWSSDYRSCRFRIRVNGKWWPKGEKIFYTRTQIRDFFWQHII